MTFKTEQLIGELNSILAASKSKVQAMSQMNLEQLNHKASPESWSALQCLEHLNNYGNYYLPELEKRIRETLHTSASSTFKPGVLGNYFANLMREKKGKIKSMKSPENMRPAASDLSHATADRFLKQLDMLEDLVKQASRVNLQRTKTSISLSSLIKLRLGDTLRFLVYHIERHLKQAEKAASKA